MDKLILDKHGIASKVRRYSRRMGDRLPKNLSHWLYFFPASIFYVPFIILSILLVFLMSFFQWKGVSLIGITFVGLDNYLQILSDPLLFESFSHNLFLLAGSLLLNTTGGLLLALGIHAAHDRFKRYYQTVFILPLVFMVVAVSIVWSYIFNPTYGLVNPIIQTVLNVDWAPIWLADKKLALPVILLASSWQYIGFNMLLWLAGLENIDKKYAEAAKLDGVSRIRIFRYITLPLLKPIAVFTALIGVIGSFRVFGYVWVMTQGGPGHSTEVVVTWMYKNAFLYTSLGKAASIAVILFIIIMAVSLISLHATNYGELET